MSEKVAYYPGCSLHGSAREYDESVRLVSKKLGIELEEVPDWNCCGATSAHSFNRDLALLLPARNIKIIQEQGLDVVIPCAACFSRTCFCDHDLKNNEELREQVEKELDFSFTGKSKVYHMAQYFAEKIGDTKIKAQVKTPLKELKLVCYYGCLLVRPQEITRLGDKENPQFLDKLVQDAGAATLDWPYKTECCGASLSLSRPKLVADLVEKMCAWAKEAKADGIVTACPLCQANLEMRQTSNDKIPIFYFTEILGLAFGLKEINKVLSRHIVDTGKVLTGLKNDK